MFFIGIDIENGPNVEDTSDDVEVKV